MPKFLNILVALGAVLITVAPARAQLDNSAFTSPTPGRLRSAAYPGIYLGVSGTDSLNAAGEASEARPRAGDLRLALHAFTFFKDNEYFNKIIEGYTLYGTQLNPQVVYYPVDNLRLEGGIFLWKDFGNPQLRQVRPTFRATWTVGKQQLIFGNIRPHLHHNYIEPLFNFERVMLNPLEEGIQVRYQGTRLFVDQWVDWQRQQYRYSNYQEEVAGGVSSSYRISPDGSPWTVALPLQFTAIHRGGQIDTLDKPLQTVFNGALGLDARYKLDGTIVQALRFNGYGVGYQDYSFTKGQFPFRRGWGLYLNGTLETRYADLMVSYWRGERFLSVLGGDLYQGASRTVSNPTYVEPNRQLLILRFMRDFRIADAAAVTARIEPVFDLNNSSLFDYSFSMYLNFRQEWLLGNVGRRTRVGM